MVSYSRRLKSGHITCYLNRTYHVLLTHSEKGVVFPGKWRDNPSPHSPWLARCEAPVAGIPNRGGDQHVHYARRSCRWVRRARKNRERNSSSSLDWWLR